MLSGLHILLTYRCLYSCDHCFLYCGPESRGTFTRDALERALAQGIDAGIDTVYFEGGEPFLFYPLMLEGLRITKSSGLRAGVVTNCYWATSERDAVLWLAPLVELGLQDLSLSDDAFHCADPAESPAKAAARAARALGLPAASICIDPPRAEPTPSQDGTRAIVGGDVVFRGRAVERLTAGLPRRHYSSFDRCPHEVLDAPSRVHLDPFGNVLVCQGISMGNIWQRPLRELLASYEPQAHPVIGPLLAGGPAELARRYGLPHGDEYVDHCQLCFLVRRQLLDRYPAALCPPQVYGATS